MYFKCLAVSYIEKVSKLVSQRERDNSKLAFQYGCPLISTLCIILFPLLLQIMTSTKKFTLFPFKETSATYEARMLLIVLLIYSEIQPSEICLIKQLVSLFKQKRLCHVSFFYGLSRKKVVSMFDRDFRERKRFIRILRD